MTISDENLKKVKDVLTTEWQPTIDIAHWAEISPGETRRILKQLRKTSEVERMWDGLIGKAYWRLPCGESFHRASDEVNPCQT